MDINQYKEKLVNNTIWNAIERYSILGIQLLCTFILGRFLTPEDFGIVGMLVVFTTISCTIIDSGFCQAFIREKNITNIDYSSVFYFNVVLSVFLYAILFFSSGLIADFYHQPILKDICKVTFLVLPCSALNLVQSTILIRNLQFKKHCVISLCAVVFSSIITITFAYYKPNVWALVIQNLSTYLLRSLFLWISVSWRPSLVFSMKSIKRLFTFSKNLLFTGLIGDIFNNIYPILIGHYYTAADLGYYSLADRTKTIASYTSTKVIQGVTYPILSRINNEGGNLREAYRNIIIISVIFVGSIMTLLMSISFDIFEVLLGDKCWRTAGTYLFILCISGIMYPLHAINQNILLVKGESRTVLFLELTRRCIMIFILVLALQFDIIVLVWSGVVYSFLLLFLNLYYCGKPINYGTWDQFKDLIPIIFRFIIMLVSTLCVSCFIEDMHILLRIVVSLCVCSFSGYLLFYKNIYFQKIQRVFFDKIKV